MNKIDSRSTYWEMMKANKAKTTDLVELEKNKVSAVEKKLSDASVPPGQFVLTIKTAGGSVKYMTSFVIGGHRDSMMHLIVHQH